MLLCSLVSRPFRFRLTILGWHFNILTGFAGQRFGGWEAKRLSTIPKFALFSIVLVSPEAIYSVNFIKLLIK